MEIIVVDDGSEDDTARILKNTHLDIKYIRQKNQGVSSARNRGIKEARGEWVAFLDSDDEWHPDYLSRQEEILAKYPSAIASILNGEDRSNPQNFINKYLENGMLERLGANRDTLINTPFQDVVRYHITILDCCIFRRETLWKTRLFDESLTIGEDHDIMLQMALKGPFAFCSEIGALIYRREESIMNLSSQLYRSGLKTRLCWALVFERFLRSGQLIGTERKALCFKYSRNQRALGNLYLRVGDTAKAREAYRQAWHLRNSVGSAARLAFAFLPFRIGKLLLHKEGNVSPGFLRTL
jgi:glycosyltransferase involved in cell wall biosynthesis